jgi:UDP-N-acetylglucosamine--N-acetylmuramyl-(pentapeptide) pyrophosphoryl-undecaprenol N-acetylglucosamine transferase
MISIAFAGGGTGGHIYPGLAVASVLKQRIESQGSASETRRIIWIGSNTGMDKSIVGREGIEFFGIPSGKLRRYFSLRNFLDIFKIIAGFFAARKILKREKITLLFSKGGFASVPPVVAAASLKIPVFTHESDFSPGLATKINSRFSKRIFVTYQGTVDMFRQAERGRITVTGNPVRAAFRSADPKIGCAFLGVGEGERILLVLGGSQGAQEVNELVKSCLSELTNIYTVVHQTGAGIMLLESERYKPYPYIGEEMPHLLAAAELVLGRSGAGTIWESAAVGKPLVLIPLRGSGTRGDQVENARFFAEKGAAVVLADKETTPQDLVQTVLSLANDETRLKSMAAASAKLGSLDAAGTIADIMIGELNQA